MGGTDSPGVLRTPLATVEPLLVHGQSSAGEWSDFGVHGFFAAATFPVGGAEPLRRSLPEAMAGRSRYVLSCENAWPWYDCIAGERPRVHVVRSHDGVASLAALRWRRSCAGAVVGCRTSVNETDRFVVRRSRNQRSYACNMRSATDYFLCRAAVDYVFHAPLVRSSPQKSK